MNTLKIIILSICFFIAQTTCIAQKFTLSDNTFDEFSMGYTKVIGQDETGYFILTSNKSIDRMSERSGQRNRKYRIGYLNTDLQLKWRRDINAYPDDADIDAISFVGENVIILSSLEFRKELEVSYFISYIDSSGQVINKEKPIAKIKLNNNDYDKARIILSSAKQSFGIFTREYINDDKQKLFAIVMNSDLSNSTIKTFMVDFSYKSFDIVDYCIGDNGDLGILGVNSEKIKALSSKRLTKYFLYSSPADSMTFNEFNVSNNKNITGIGIAYDNLNRQIILAGFYSETNSFLGAGIYYASLDMEKNDEVVIKSQAIVEHKNLKLKGERNSGSGLDLISYPIERIILRNDGGAVIVAESAYISEYSYYDSFSQSFSRRLEYNFDNILVISINSDGIVDWSSIINKQQSSLDDGGVFSSFCSLLNGEQLLVLFNDQITRRNKIVPVSVNNQGEQVKLNTHQLKDGILLIPRNGKQVSENEILIPALIKRKLYFLKVTI